MQRVVTDYEEDRHSAILGIREHFSFEDIESLLYTPTRLEIRTVNRVFISVKGTEDGLIEVTICRVEPLSRSKLYLEVYEFK